MFRKRTGFGKCPDRRNGFFRECVCDFLFDGNKTCRNRIQILIRNGKGFHYVVQRNWIPWRKIFRSKEIVFNFSKLSIQFIVSVRH